MTEWNLERWSYLLSLTTIAMTTVAYFLGSPGIAALVGIGFTNMNLVGIAHWTDALRKSGDLRENSAEGDS